jgi:hypothetical protein
MQIRRTLPPPLPRWRCSARAVPADDTALGTLFYSPTQRLAIAKARRQEAEPGTSEGLIRFDGAIASRHGLRSAWVNGRELELAHQDGVQGLSVLQGQTVRLAPGLNLKVGQSASLAMPAGRTIWFPKAAWSRRAPGIGTSLAGRLRQR